jgi:hypothetical protein
MKLGFLMWLLVVAITASVCTCADPPGPTEGRTYTIEYDHQMNYDVLLWEKRPIEDAFAQAKTTLDFKYDNEELPDYWVRLDSLYEYYIAHVRRYSSGASWTLFCRSW